MSGHASLRNGLDRNLYERGYKLYPHLGNEIRRREQETFPEDLKQV